MRLAVVNAPFLVLVTIAVAMNIPPDHFLRGPGDAISAKMSKVKRQTESSSSTRTTSADPVCTNSPSTRNCWSNGYSVATDFDQKWPETGQTRTFNLEITNTTCNPDGNGERICLLYNKQYPGPTIWAGELKLEHYFNVYIS